MRECYVEFIKSFCKSSSYLKSKSVASQTTKYKIKVCNINFKISTNGFYKRAKLNGASCIAVIKALPTKIPNQWQ